MNFPRLNFVLGTAAELIKVYPLLHSAVARGWSVRVLSTGQSRENFIRQYRDFALPESALVPLLESNGDLERFSSALRWLVRAMLISKSTFRAKLLPGDAPAYVVVHGDTLSTLIGAWLGWRRGLPVVHVEAGLRSPRLFNPFPEEITRRLVSQLASLHMAPDGHAVENLRRAKVAGEIVCTRGNTLMDAVPLAARLGAAVDPHASAFALVNIHRFENLNSPTRWSAILTTVKQAAQKVKVIFVAHPQTRHKLEHDREALTQLTQAGIEIHDRMPFTRFIGLLQQAEFLISDGGSNQEECSYLGKPCLILRESTERREGLDTCCLLSRFDQKLIDRFLANPRQYQAAPLNQQSLPSEIILDTLFRQVHQ